jgi:hypothetical protein
MEQGPTFRVTVPKYPTKDPNHRILAGQKSRFTHDYFYIRDEAVSLSYSRRRPGDAWLLDPTDQLAARVARNGEPEPVHIEETDVAFAIDWKGRYRIEGAAFVFVDRNTHQTRTILGYPTHQLEHVGQG